MSLHNLGKTVYSLIYLLTWHIPSIFSPMTSSSCIVVFSRRESSPAISTTYPVNASGSFLTWEEARREKTDVETIIPFTNNSTDAFRRQQDTDGCVVIVFRINLKAVVNLPSFLSSSRFSLHISHTGGLLCWYCLLFFISSSVLRRSHYN